MKRRKKYGNAWKLSFNHTGYSVEQDTVFRLGNRYYYLIGEVLRVRIFNLKAVKLRG